MTLENKVAVITGGNGYIGYTVAQRLAGLGARVFILVRRRLESAQEMMQKLPNNHLQHQALLADVKDSAQVKQAVATVKQLAGRCDILINAAGIGLHGHISEVTEEIFDETIAVNLKGPWIVSKEFYELLKASGDGLVVNISSVASIRPRPDSFAYSISKVGLNMMTQAMAKGLGPEVRFVAIAPSRLPNLTSGDPMIEKDNKHPTPQVIQNCINGTPIKRLGTADDVADVIESLATKIKFYNGHLIALDGGLML
jgi:NAD(P)-dependent dehydrogenase (short-subunit alcohol dehydrogenase family)